MSAPAPAGGPAPAAGKGAPLLQTRGLGKTFRMPRSTRAWLRREAADELRAVADVALTLEAGRTLGVVGETGSGKSTLGRLVLRLEEPSSGQVLVDGEDVHGRDRAGSGRLRRDVQVVLQDPYTSLNPHQRVGSAVEEVLRVHGKGSPDERDGRVHDLLERVGFPPGWADRRPGQLSGGGRQRVSIARALAVEPRLLVADEPVSALDVSVQAQVLNLFQRLQRELGLAYLFITHDLAVLERLADEVAVLYLGRIVEKGPADALFRSPRHPYTEALLQAAPRLGRPRGAGSAISGEIPNPISPPGGCTFHPRCPRAMDVCRVVRPRATSTPEGLEVACHLYPGSTPEQVPTSSQAHGATAAPPSSEQ